MSRARLALAAAALASWPAFLPAQQPGVSPALAREIEAVEADLQAGLAKRDRAMLEPLVAEPFTWVHASDGRVDTRERWLAMAASGMALTGQRNARTEHGSTLVAYGGAEPHTVVRVSRVRLLDASGGRESWLRQTHTLVRGADGKWRLAIGQGVVMYEGPLLDKAMHARYAGTYALEDGRVLKLQWTDEALMATFPAGAVTQIFLASPTEEASRTLGTGSLRFTLDANGAPVEGALVRAGQEQWRARRKVEP